MTHPYKLQVKIGAAEFTAEGPEDAVKEQFQQFLSAVNQSPAAATTPKQQPPKAANGSPPVVPSPEVLQRAFTTDSRGIVSLQILPETSDRNADTVLLSIYGFHQVGQLESVPATQLMDAVERTGLGLDRLDRTLAQYIPRFIRRGGVRRGTRYSLTNQGKAHAAQLLAELTS